MAHRQVTPTHYGQGHQDSLRFRSQPGPGKNQGALYAALHRALPIGWPGVPPEAFLGFSQISMGATEDTVRPDNTQHWHEIGYFQTPAGPRDGPAPNPDPAADMNLWGRLATTNYVRAMLPGRRAATMVPGAWMDAIADQVAVGLGDLHGGSLAVSRQLGAAGAQDPSSTWAVGLGFGAFERGPAGEAAAIAPWKDELAQVPEANRWSTWADLIDRDVRSGKVSWTAQLPYLATWRKFEGGRQLAHSLGTSDAYDLWYDAPRVDEDVWIARTAEGAGIVDTPAERALAARETASAAAVRARGPRARGPRGGSILGPFLLAILAALASRGRVRR
jgi:hypothetical protein